MGRPTTQLQTCKFKCESFQIERFDVNLHYDQAIYICDNCKDNLVGKDFCIVFNELDNRNFTIHERDWNLNLSIPFPSQSRTALMDIELFNIFYNKIKYLNTITNEN